MSKPPAEIDRAEVLEWAWSGEMPFGVVRDESGDAVAEIFGLAICRYLGARNVYRFSCDTDWETEQDAGYSSVDEAKNYLPAQYQEVKVKWQKYE